ncbi:prolyl oligopeptidase family serine peptidase [Trinickia sp. Y13]|uniref:prolyl oligopeptidase family serine peptidase n=1 Tax=Trinickia sp. Y13 TaxID=2917807 RepID=UPI002406EC42|nr:prolyl oligopeptidase family serine peptidase [Trinickia sp. Y13]MDG0024200.1 prolyl oligopeptidase family serine peptidase [Trinickia sp. Y13]
MKRNKSLWVVTLLSCLTASSAAWCADTPPVAPVRPVTDTYFGTPFVDNYRYMENLKDPEVQSWMKAQDDYTRRVLAAIPGRDALAARIETLMGGDLRRTDFTRRGHRLFYQTAAAGENLFKLAYRDGVDGPEHVLVDPAQLSTDSSRHFALDWYAPSWDGRYVAYGISEGGSEKSVLHVVDVESGKTLAEAIDRTSACVVSWRNDNRSFFYLRYPQAGPDTPPALSEYNAVTRLHVLGRHADGEGDEAVFGRGVSPKLDVPEGQGAYVLLSPDSPYAVAVANHNMDENPNTFYVARVADIHGAGTPWKKIASPEDGVVDVQLRGDRLYALTGKDAPRFKLVSAPLAQPDLAHAQVVVPEGANVIDTFTLASDGIYLAERAGATFELHRTNLDGKHGRTIGLPFAGAIRDLKPDAKLPGVMFELRGWIKAPRELAYAPGAQAAADTGLIPPSKTESDELEAQETFATSYDGTRVPVSIISKKGILRDGSHPTIIYGYGSYGLSLDPNYQSAWRAWFEQGGIMTVVHMRGGGEYGDAWHRAGQKRWKINTMFDFLAGAQYMIDQGYTQRRYLVANGRSAGGIVMGGALTIDPGLFRVVLDDVGVSDALRFETEPNGPPNVPEMGSTSNEAGFHGLYAMSAYAHIHDGTPYPAVMFTTGANDPRVSPWHMLKMTARVQAATSSGRPVLLRVDYDAGHGIGSSVKQTADRFADEWAFSLWQVGAPGFQPKAH